MGVFTRTRARVCTYMSSSRKRLCAETSAAPIKIMAGASRMRYDADDGEREADPTGDDGSAANQPTLDGDDDEWEPCNVDSFYNENKDGVCILCRYTVDREKPGSAARACLKYLECELSINSTVGITHRVDAAYDYYNANLRPLLERDGRPEWTKDSIRGHLMAAHGTGQLQLVRAAHEGFVGPLMHVLRSNMILQSKRDRRQVRFDHKTMGQYFKIAHHLYNDMDAPE